MSTEAKRFYPHPENREVKQQPIYTARIYPGQGSQFPGMGKELYKTNSFAQKIYREADNISRRMRGPKIIELSFEADEQTLMKTENVQPVIFTHNFVCEQILIQQGAEGYTTSPWALAGSSLGEYNTLVTSKAMTFENALKLVIIRGKLMADADSINPGGLLAVTIDENDPRLEQALNNFHLQISLINTKNQTILGGKNDDINNAGEWLKTNIGPRSFTLLPVKGAFHTSLMQPCVDEFSDILSTFPIRKAKIPIIANTLASPIQTPDEIREELVNQLTNTVLWRDSMLYITKNGVEHMFEPGTDRAILSRMNETISGGKMTRRIFPGVPASAWAKSS